MIGIGKRSVFVSLAAGLVLAGCTSGAPAAPKPTVAPNPTVAPAPAPSVAAAAAPSPSVVPAAAAASPAFRSDAKIVIGSSASLSWLPIQVAIERGYFKDAGLSNVSFTTIDSAPNAANALAAGEIQFAGLAFERAALSTIGGKPVQCVVAIQDTPPSSLVVSAKLDVKPGDWPALKGKTIGIVQGGWSEIFPKYLLKKAGIDLNDVKFTSTPNTATMLAGLKSGQIDGFSGIEPAQRQAIAEGMAKMFFDLEDPANLEKFWPSPFQATCLQAQAGYAKSNPEIVRAIRTGITRALQDVHANPSVAVDLAAKASPTVDRAIWDASVKALVVTWSRDGAITEKAVENVQQLLMEYGVLPRALPYADIVNSAK